MNDTWILMLVVWAIVEFIQFLRKRPFPQRMKTGAWWGIIFAALAALGGASKEVNTGTFLVIALALYGTGAAIIYGIRLIIAKVWARIFGKKNTETI